MGYTVVWMENMSDSRPSYETHISRKKAEQAYELIRVLVDPKAQLLKGSPLDRLGKIH